MTVDGAVRPFSPADIAEALDTVLSVILDDAPVTDVSVERGLTVDEVRARLAIVTLTAMRRFNADAEMRGLPAWGAIPPQNG